MQNMSLCLKMQAGCEITNDGYDWVAKVVQKKAK